MGNERKRQEEEAKGKGGKEEKTETRILRIALQELAISADRYTMITRGSLGNQQLLDLIKR